MLADQIWQESRGSVQVSVIMPCHNCVAHVSQSIASVLAQTFGDFELLIIDNASTDDSRLKIAQQQDARIHLLSEEEKGVSHARNRGLAEAKGKFIAFLDADDTWEPTFLEKMCSALESVPHAELAYCGWQNLGVSGGRGEPFIPPDYETADKWDQLVGGCRWPIHATLTRHEAIRTARGFDPRFAVGEDFLLWMEIGCFHAIKRVPDVLAYYHHHGGEQATKNQLRAILETCRVQLAFLQQHPEVENKLGKTRVRELIYGNLLHNGYAAYWRRDLATARGIFRVVMKAGYGKPKDWLYMLPAWLPFSFHASLIRLVEIRKAAHER